MHETGRWCTIRAIACVATLALMVPSAGAQNPPPASTNTRPFVAIGCISRANQSSRAASRGGSPASQFVITDTRGETPLIYRLDGDANALSVHVGHMMEVAGTVAASTSGQRGIPVMKVKSLTWIATSCAKAR